MHAFAVPKTLLNEVWPDIEHLIVQALEKTGAVDDYDPIDILDMLLQGQAILWLAAEDKPVCAVVTRVLAYPKRQVLSVFLASSEPHTKGEWMQFFELLEAYALDNGIHAIRIGGRKGWVKEFNPKHSTTLFTINVGRRE